MDSLQELLDLLGPELVPLVLVLGVYLLSRFFLSSSSRRRPSPPFPDIFSDKPDPPPVRSSENHDEGTGKTSSGSPSVSEETAASRPPLRPQSPLATAGAGADERGDVKADTEVSASASASTVSDVESDEEGFWLPKDKESLRRAWLYGEVFGRRV